MEQSGLSKLTGQSLALPQLPTVWSTSAVLIANGLVYFGGFDGILYAVDAQTGAMKWTFVFEYERRFEGKRLHGYPSGFQTIPDSWDIYTSSPAVSNGRVYIGSGDGNVYCVDALTGVLQWKFATGDIVHASPALPEKSFMARTVAPLMPFRTRRFNALENHEFKAQT